MNGSVLIAGIGNIFHGDDAFGVEVVRKLAEAKMPEGVRMLDIGIRAIDLAFALLDGHDLVVLIDATSRGGAPGTLYTIEIESDEISEVSVINSHSLNPVRVLALAKSMGAKLNRVLLIGCEPLVLEREETGYIGLSEPVAAALAPAVQRIHQLVEEFTETGETCCYERA